MWIRYTLIIVSPTQTSDLPSIPNHTSPCPLFLSYLEKQTTKQDTNDMKIETQILKQMTNGKDSSDDRGDRTVASMFCVYRQCLIVCA